MRKKHPLDTELLDLVDDLVPPSLREEIDGHLRTCGLCRLKVLRIRGSWLEGFMQGMRP